MKEFKNFVGTIEFLDENKEETGMRVFAILNGTSEDDIVNAIPIEMFAGGKIEFHQTIEDDEFKVISIDGDKISDLMDFIPLEKPTVEDKTDEITLDDFVSADK